MYPFRPGLLSFAGRTRTVTVKPTAKNWEIRIASGGKMPFRKLMLSRIQVCVSLSTATSAGRRIHGCNVKKKSSNVTLSTILLLRTSPYDFHLHKSLTWRLTTSA